MKSIFTKLSFCEKRRAQGQKGQAIVEYILVLVVVVSVILGAIYQLNQAFRSYADAYFGEYLTCLLETGDLPSIGNTDNETDCLAPKFSAETVIANNKKESEADDKKSNKLDDDGSEDKNSKEGGGGDNDDSSEGSSAGRASLEGTSSRFRIKNVRRNGGGSGDGGDEESSLLLSGAGVNGGYYNVNEGRPERRRIVWYKAGGASKKEKDDKKPTKAKNIEAGNEMKSGPVLTKISLRTPSNQADIDLNPPGFGDYLRYLIMIAIFIMLIVFIGGQAMEIFKSME